MGGPRMKKGGTKGPRAISRAATWSVVKFYLLLGSAWIVVTDGAVYLHGGVALVPGLFEMSKGLFFIGMTGCALFFYMIRCRREDLQESETLHQRLTQLSRYANDIVLLLDENGLILDANDRAVDAYGFPLPVLKTKTINEVRQSDVDWLAAWGAVQERGEVRFETVHKHASGSVFPVEVSSRRIDVGGRLLVQSIIRDISERKEAEQKIIRLKDVYAALSQTNQNIVRVSNRDDLFRSICEIAATLGHFQLSWIGILDEATKAIVPVAMAGTELTYLDGVTISADPASVYSTGPTGQAVITGKHVIANDLRVSMLGKPWQERWTKFDMKASAAFPLFFQGQAIGTLTLYSKHAGFFTPDLINLLDEMALDISFAMDRIEADRERVRLNKELIASNAQIQGIIEGTEDIVAAVNNDLNLTLCNEVHKEFLRKSLNVEPVLGTGIEAWAAHPSSPARLLASSLKRALGGERLVEKWSSLKDGDEIYFESYFAPLLDPDGKRIGAFHVGRDVSQHRKMEYELRKLTTAVEQSPVTVVITDLDANIQYVNPCFTAVTGYSAEEVMGKNPRILQGGNNTREEYQAMWESITAGQPWFGLLHNKRKDGTLFWEEAVISPVRDAAGSISQYVAIKQDITPRLEAEERASFLTFHDPLTSLPNRMLGKTYMESAMDDADASGCKSALLFLDVDNFKRINDSLGHRIGDHLLQAIAARIQNCLRSTDTLSRSGGDEFLVVLSAVKDSAEIGTIAATILEQTRAPFAIEGFELSVTLSIGVAAYPDDSREFDLLHKRADMAMYFAKKSGRNTFRFYTEKMEADANEYLLILNGLRKALERREFVLHYQPQFSLSSGEIVGAEALIRWNHPELGLIQPGRFISVAEDSGLIVEVGQWVLEEACRQAVRWQEAGLGRLVIAVNLSAIQFKRAGLPEIVRGALEESRLDPSCLQLELTESILIENEAKVQMTVKALKSLGVGLSLDDFGTGYASFGYLRNFDLDDLKIDQSFIREITTNPGDEKIVKSIVELARGFGLRTTAEGVEDQDALEIVRAAGCDKVQGFHLARPMRSDDFSALVSAQMTARPVAAGLTEAAHTN